MFQTLNLTGVTQLVVRGLPVKAAALLGIGLVSGLTACSNGYDVPRPSVAVRRPAEATAGYGPYYAPRSAAASTGGYKIGAPYRIGTNWYVPHEDPTYDRAGTGSWYGADFHGRRTANGEIYNMDALTAAHPTLPLPSYVHVTNLANGRTILVRVNDRGPYVDGRMIDLSRAGARALGYDQQGTARLRVQYAGRAPLNGDAAREQQFLASQPWYGAPSRRPEMAAATSPYRAPVSVPYEAPASGWSSDTYRRSAGPTASATQRGPSWSSPWSLGGSTGTR